MAYVEVFWGFLRISRDPDEFLTTVTFFLTTGYFSGEVRELFFGDEWERIIFWWRRELFFSRENLFFLTTVWTFSRRRWLFLPESWKNTKNWEFVKNLAKCREYHPPGTPPWKPQKMPKKSRFKVPDDLELYHKCYQNMDFPVPFSELISLW